MQWTKCESNPQPLTYESDTLPLHHCTHIFLKQCYSSQECVSYEYQKGALVKIVSHGTEYEDFVLMNLSVLGEAAMDTASREPTQKYSSITCTNPSTPDTCTNLSTPDICTNHMYQP